MLSRAGRGSPSVAGGAGGAGSTTGSVDGSGLVGRLVGRLVDWVVGWVVGRVDDPGSALPPDGIEAPVEQPVRTAATASAPMADLMDRHVTGAH